MLHSRKGLLAIVTCLLLSGCGGPDTGGRLAVSGKVTFQGQPLKTGTIEFASPDGERGGASIVNGAYDIPAVNGLMPGKYVARVTSVVSTEAAPEMPGESKAIEKANKDQIPAEFNTKSTLTYEALPGKSTTFDVSIP